MYLSHFFRYDPKKGFFCQVVSATDHTKCLGKSKGRQYPPMEERSYKLLQVSSNLHLMLCQHAQHFITEIIFAILLFQRYYLSHNTALVKLLKKLNHVVPQWLKDDLSDTEKY